MRKSLSEVNANLPPATRSIADTQRWLEFVQSDHWWLTQMPVYHKSVDDLLGKRRFYQRQYPSDTAWIGLSRLIPLIERRSIIFTWRNIFRAKKGTRGAPRVLFVDPPAFPPRIAKLSKESEWSVWACCGSCGNNQFLPVVMNGAEHVACYHCLPPSQHPSIGAKETSRSLIDEAVRKYYVADSPQDD